MISPQILLTDNIILNKQVIFWNIYVYTCKHMHTGTINEKQNSFIYMNRYMGRFRGRKDKGVIMYLYYNLKLKEVIF